MRSQRSGTRERHLLLGVLDQVGGIGAAVDSALPALVFALVFATTGRSLRPAVWSAVGVGALLLIVRLLRREPVRNAVGGFVAIALAAAIAAATGRAADYFLVSIVRNAALALGYAASILLRYPLIGVLVGLARGSATGFRSDPAQLRAYSRATWIWVALFLVRLGVRTPLLLASDVTWLGVTEVVMGWPLFAATILATYLYLRRALHADSWAQAEAAIRARRPGAAPPSTTSSSTVPLPPTDVSPEDTSR